MSLIMLLGPPGSGKGEQCARLASMGWQTVSTGQLLRNAASLDDARGHALRGMLQSGALVPDEYVVAVLKEHLATHKAGKLILDGFPRTLSQIHVMSSLGLMPEKVFVMVIPDDVIVDRLGGRLIEPKSGRVYHQLYHPPKVANIDDVTGDPLERRKDDHPDVIRARLKIYHKTVQEMLAFFSEYQQRNKLSTVYLDATFTIEAVHEVIKPMVA